VLGCEKRYSANGSVKIETCVRNVGYNIAVNKDKDAAIILSERLNKLPNPFNARDVYRKKWYLLHERDDIEKACEILIENNWLAIDYLPAKKNGRPSLPRYFINPQLLTSTTD
jgi:hypothetical protein